MQSLERLGPFFLGGRIGFLLVHGLAGTPAEMKILGKRLNRYGFTVLCPQLAGHCASEEELITTCWSDWSRSVEDAFDALSRHMDAVFVGGLSAGAVLSLRHAQRYPGRARGLALYSTTLRYDGWTIPKLSFLLPLILKTPYFGKRYRFEEAFPSPKGQRAGSSPLAPARRRGKEKERRPALLFILVSRNPSPSQKASGRAPVR